MWVTSNNSPNPINGRGNGAEVVGSPRLMHGSPGTHPCPATAAALPFFRGQRPTVEIDWQKGSWTYGSLNARCRDGFDEGL